MNNFIKRHVKIHPDVLFQAVNGETVLLNLKNERYFGLDEVGTRIWQLLNDDGDLQKVFEIMLDEYDVDAFQLEQDIGKLVGELVEAGLIEIRIEEEKQ